MWRPFLVLLALPPAFAAQQQPLPPPAEATPLTYPVALAAADAGKLGPQATRTRWLWLTEAANQREAAWRVISGHLHLLSRQPLLYPPLLVLSNGEIRHQSQMRKEDWQQAALVRVDLDKYGFGTKTWDELGTQDPYFHALITGPTVKVARDRTTNELIWLDGSTWRRVNDAPPPVGTVLAAAPWLADANEDKAALAALFAATQSTTPLLRADNFVWQTAVQSDRKVGYYGMLGVKNRADFEKLVGLDRKASGAFSPELLAAVANSGVARQPRRVARFASLGGGTWVTFDSKEALNEFNPLRFLNGGYKHDAEEWYGLGSNGFWKTGLFAADGTRQDSAPDFIGFDRFAHGNDGRIHVGLSCVRCHSDGGLQNVRDSVRNTYAGVQVLLTPDPVKSVEIEQRYFQELNGKVKRDREVYAEALLAATGLTPANFAAAYSDYFARYDAPVDARKAAAELGTTEKDMLARFDAMRKAPAEGKAAAGLDPVLGLFTVDEKRRESVGREQWNEAFNLAQLALRGLTAWPVSK